MDGGFFNDANYLRWSRSEEIGPPETDCQPFTAWAGGGVGANL
jgi:hypothetical protein